MTTTKKKPTTAKAKPQAELTAAPEAPSKADTAKFHPGHRVEEHAKVYLRLADDGTRWEIDPITFDGFPLDGLKNGPTPTESDCECTDRKQCWEVHNHAAFSVPLPTGAELFTMLTEFCNGGK